MSMFLNCQSCGMPLKVDPGGGGTNIDGSKSDIYCSMCYKNGEFTQPDFTVDDMMAYGTEKLLELGFPKMMVKVFINTIPKLKRWTED